MIPVSSHSLISSADEQASVVAPRLASSGFVLPSRSSWQTRVGSVLSCVGAIAVSILSPLVPDIVAAPSMASPSEFLMRHAPDKSRPRFVLDRTVSAADPTAVGERTVNFLRRVHPSATAVNVAADLRAWRVKSATIAKMLERQSTPSTLLWIAMTCVYGPEFLCAVLDHPPAWLDAAQRTERQQDLERRIAALQSELAGLK